MSRRDLALRLPDPDAYDFGRFPVRRLTAGSVWFRQHRDRPRAPDRGAWFFSSHPVGTVGDGRFDLPFTPNDQVGTCYLASTDRAAVNELVGPDCARRGWVDADLVTDRVVSRLLLPTRIKAALTTSTRAADFGVTNELATTERYDITQAWAATLRAAGFEAMLVLLRFSPGPARGLALFGPSGTPAPAWQGDSDPVVVRALLESIGISVVERPSFSDVVIAEPEIS